MHHDGSSNFKHQNNDNILNILSVESVTWLEHIYIYMVLHGKNKSVPYGRSLKFLEFLFAGVKFRSSYKCSAVVLTPLSYHDPKGNGEDFFIYVE